MIKKAFCLPLFLVLFAFAKANGTPELDSILDPNLLIEDLEQLDDLIREAHVAPFTYCTEEEYIDALNIAKANSSNGLTYYQFTAEVGQFLQVLEDSHTSLNLSALSAVYKENDGLFMNFSLLSTSERAHYIKEDRFGKLSSGAELLEINGIPFDSIYRESFKMSVQEGTSPEGLLAVADAISIPMAGVWMEIKAVNTLLLKMPSGEEKEVAYPGKLYDEWKTWNKKNYQRKELYELTYLSDSIAHMRIQTFAAANSNKYNKFVKRSFKELKKKEIPHLLLDLRHNGGGKANRMEYLYNHITDSQNRLPDNIIAKQSSTSRKLHARSYKGLNKFILTKLLKNNEEAKNYVHIVSLADSEVDTVFYNEPPSEVKFPYQGSCILLIDGLSGSASVNFAAGFRMVDAGPIYGQPCLGPITGTWGNPSNEGLSNSGLNIFISTIRFNADRLFEVSDKAIAPDVLVIPDPILMSQNKDAVIEKVLFDLKQKKNTP